VILLALITELINSGMEAVVDRFGGEQHELSGRAKDVASAAVLIALLNVVLVWGCILFT
jgi:diacylglycerol kinase (ATP)